MWICDSCRKEIQRNQFGDIDLACHSKNRDERIFIRLCPTCYHDLKQLLLSKLAYTEEQIKGDD